MLQMKRGRLELSWSLYMVVYIHARTRDRSAGKTADPSAIHIKRRVIACGARSIDRDHHVRGLDDRICRLAGRQLELVDRLVGDGRRHDRSSDVDANVRRGLALLHLDDLAFENVARTELH